MHPSRRREKNVQWEQIYQGPCLRYIPMAVDYGFVVTATSVRPLHLSSSPSFTSSSGKFTTTHTRFPSIASSHSSSSSSASSTPAAAATTGTKKPHQPFDFEARITNVSLVYPYLIGFGLSMVEIWDVEKAMLVQVIHQPTLQCLCDTTLCTISDAPANNKSLTHHPSILVGQVHDEKAAENDDRLPKKAAPYSIYELHVNHTSSPPFIFTAH
ncbi:hypothetical protein BC940DRAFT_157701 [Gongronella butleri]|nr:hypothetical protein BC940DRAFT_157701 [Gongronella butleri]